MAKPLDFIDRKAEIKLFESILTRNAFERVLTFLVKPEKGKTYLMNYLLEYCHQQGIPTALVDFDTRQKRGVVSYWKFVRQICDQLGEENFPEVIAYERRHYDPVLPLVSIQTGRGEAGTHFGTKGHFEEAELASISGRDLITMGDITFHEAKDQSAIRQERLMHEMGRALRSDLVKFCAQNQVVLLLDTYEHASLETRNWIDEWLFCHLLDSYPNLIIVVAGQPKLHDFFSQPRPWQALMRLREEFSAPDEEDVRHYTEVWSLDIVGDELRAFVKIASQDVALLAKMRDIYRRLPDE